jgi:putative serine protease PepD
MTENEAPERPQEPIEEPPHRLGRGRLVVGSALVAIVLAGGAAGGAAGLALHVDNAAAPKSVTSSTGTAVTVVDRSSLTDVAAALEPSVVDIKTDSAEGSGIVVTADGYVATNNHVIAGASSVTVTLSTGEQLPATVVGTDEQTDIAVLRVDRADLIAASWGDSDSVSVGDTVLALGSPLGLQGTVTAGIVSAVHRTITVSAEQRSHLGIGTTTIGDAIQTDAAINSGSSGGALVNTNAAVIGINSAIATTGSSGSIGVGFAIPSNTAKPVIDAIIARQQ